jgi:hypothetical protein
MPEEIEDLLARVQQIRTEQEMELLGAGYMQAFLFDLERPKGIYDEGQIQAGREMVDSAVQKCMEENPAYSLDPELRKWCVYGAFAAYMDWARSGFVDTGEVAYE